ncbi:glycogen debranching N-terminal domain-containing protein [Frondihabitans australicus]|uniref:Amylo-alpha-1,6-glucosidase n=1 Tax=Frondihabitans australicus TaxID=386892 RepID=A0A495IJK1_9MICO|nr:glycogen debranching N-terminal domain-containing protein [Frondihabitans australicus]RKR76202.1 amylo-alpha-1,6-glucosidase [Frondihabitans australicus]
MTDTLTPTALQPFLDAETVVLRAPAQAWSAPDGSMGAAAIHGVYLGDLRILADLSLTVDGAEPEPIATVPIGASTVRFESLLRGLDDAGADPDVRASVLRVASTIGIHERLTLTSRLDREIGCEVSMSLRADATTMELVKAGLATSAPVDVSLRDGLCEWGTSDAAVTLHTHSARATVDGADITLTWDVAIPARGSATVGFDLTATSEAAVVEGVKAPARWRALDPAPSDDRLARWLARALDDLEALRLTTVDAPDDVFLAAGAPWFFTLFGRDSLWAARFLLPVDDGLLVARGTLNVLAGLQGTASVAETAEQPGKIMHELRSQTLTLPGEGISLPPLYFGTVDATALWVCLLDEAWRAGLADDEVRRLLPHLRAALAWMRDYGDSDGDGLLEYVDETGHGLSNQGWKDSGDSVQWRDGTLAEGPIALVEVQAYAYQAAVAGAALLDRFEGQGAGAEWLTWAARLRSRFHESFWLHDAAGPYLAIALDARKRPVDTVTSNLGHVLGTGILDAAQAASIASRLVAPDMASGFGLRTMSTGSAGYWPLSYHGGSVWTHDTAIAVQGLALEGLHEAAAALAEGLLAAAPAFDYRMPELHSGDDARELPRPVPYPAACRPQAWSAAAAVAVWSALHRE